MMISAPLLPESVAIFLLMLTRVGTMLMLVPGLGGRSLPTRVKVVFSLVLTVVLVPFAPVDPATIGPVGDFVIAIVQECLIGLVLGLGVAVVFSAVEMASSLISFQMGLSMGPVFDPTFNSTVVPLNTFFLVIASLIFFSANGHHLMLVALQRSFVALPIGSATLTSNADSVLIGLTQAMFVDALRIGLPIAGTLIIADAALGILNRMVPQMNVFFVGLPAKIFAGIILLLLALPFLIRVLSGLMTRGVFDAVERAASAFR